MHHYDIVGWALPGCSFCPDCEPEDNEEKNPIFAGNEGWEEWSCDACGCQLGDEGFDNNCPEVQEGI